MLNAEDIEGFDALNTANAKIFRAFLSNFYTAQGSETQKNLKPISVKYTQDKANGAYLRFDYKRDNKKCWLHVQGPHIWY